LAYRVLLGGGRRHLRAIDIAQWIGKHRLLPQLVLSIEATPRSTTRRNYSPTIVVEPHEVAQLVNEQCAQLSGSVVRGPVYGSHGDSVFSPSSLIRVRFPDTTLMTSPTPHARTASSAAAWISPASSRTPDGSGAIANSAPRRAQRAGAPLLPRDQRISGSGAQAARARLTAPKATGVQRE
jgi:hypothetical protein